MTQRWPDIDVVGPGVGEPVVVDDTADRDSDGELLHEGNRVPDIVALDADRLVVGWRAGVPDSRDASPTDQGAIRYAFSGDGGRSWTIGTLAAATATHRFHYVVFLNDSGTLYALLGRITIGQDRDAGGNVDGFPTRLVARRSVDGGRTWSDFPITVEVPGNHRGVVIAGKPLKHQDTWLVPYWRQAGGTTRAGVLRSTDLITWTSGALAENPPGVAVEEPQVVVAHDAPGTLLMVARTLVLKATPQTRDAHYRTHAAYAATATSTDGGLTWSALALDPDLPNYYVKGFFTADSGGRYLTIYNTLAGPFTGPAASKPDQYREVLHYKTKRPGEDWEPGRLFADGRRLTRGPARGWDVYPSADEYEPGRFFVIWEHNQIDIKVARLDLGAAVGGDVVSGDWRDWALDGGAEIRNGVLRLRSVRGRASRASIDLDATMGYDFTVEFRGRVDDDSALDPRTGQGVSLGTKVANGARRLMLTIQRTGVWTIKKGSASWEKIYTVAAAPATWKVTTDSAGVARLFRDGADTGVTWVIQDSRERPQLTHWVTGTAGGNAAEAHIEWTRLTPTRTA